MLNKQGFPKNHRLLTSHDFKAVFNGASLKIHTPAFLVLGIPNNLTHARVGCVVAKKNARRAVQRNRIKRIIRERFRLQGEQLQTVDLVIMAKPGITKKDNSAIIQELNTIFKKDDVSRLTMINERL